MTGFIKSTESYPLNHAGAFSLPILQLLRCFIVYFLSFLLIFQPMVGYAGGIVVDGSAPASQRPGLDAAQNGVPVVNITAPSSGGVSRNTFSDFNVDSRGVIMNNSLTVGVSQLGGALPGNANFTGGKTAKIILNEVTGTGRSNLAGATEIFGDKAEYVLANPNGITCSGCGFINTPRVTLSTGIADVGADGSLKGLNVTGGDVTFSGMDSNLQNLDSFDIISRTASFASGVYAGAELNVITGSNHVDYNTKVATPIVAGSAAPQVGLDSSALGGMYAGKINLVATEAGVGVNTQGKLGASAGDIKITADGRIEFKDANAKGNIKVTSTNSSVKHSGNSYSEGNTEITAAGAVELSDGFTAAKGDVKINSATLDENSAASVMAGVDAITSGADVTFTDNGIGLLNITTSGTANNAGLLTGAGITANSGSFNNTGLVQSAGDITIYAGSISNLNNYILDANGNIAGGINTTGKLTLTSTSGNIDNTDGVLTSAGLLTITSAGSLINNSLINGSSNILINAASIDNSNSYFTDTNGYLIGGILASSNIGITTTSGGINNISGAISGNALNITSNRQLTNDSGLINSATTINTTASGVSNNGGGILASGDININAGSGNISNTAGVINTAGNIDINHAAVFSNTGLISGASSTSISANSINNNNSYNTYASGALTTGILSNGDVNLTAATGDITNNSGAVYGKNLALNSNGQLDNTAGLVQATNTTSIIANGINNSATYIKNAFGTLVKGILATSDITLAGGSGDINNTNGAINSGGNITATTTGAVTNSGLVQSASDTNIIAGSVTNSNNLHTDSNGNLDKGILSGGKLDVATTGDVNNTAGALYSAGKQTITATGAATNSGLVASGDDIGITAGAVNNSGVVTTSANTSLTANANDAQNSGTIYGNNIAVTANNGNFNNDTGLTNSSGTTTVNAKGVVNTNTYHFTNGTLDKGIISTGDLTVNAGTSGINNGLNANNRGAIYTSGKATITATNGDFNNTGLVQSTGKLTVSANNINNSNSVRLVSSNDISLIANGYIKNIAGYIAARNITATSTGKFDNTGGSVNSTGYINISANIIDNTDTYITDTNGNIVGGIIAGGTITLGGGIGDIINTGGAIIGTGNIILTTNGNIVNDSLIQSTHDITASAASIDNGDSYYANSNGVLISGILAGGSIDLTATNGGINNSNGAISAVNVVLNASGTLDNTAGFSQSSGTTTINAGNVVNDDSYLVDNSGKMVGGIISGGALNVTTGNFSNDAGAVIGSGDVTFNNSGSFTNSGLVQSADNLNITASGVDNSNSYITSGGSLIAGLIATGNVVINALSGNVNNNSGAIVADNVTVNNTAAFTNNSGMVKSGTDTNITATSIDNSNSRGIFAAGDVNLKADSGIKNDAGVVSANNINITGNTNGTTNYTASFSNIAGVLSSAADIVIHALGIDNSNTYATTNGALVKGMLAGGKVTADGGAANINNTNGAISSSDDVNITTSGTVKNSGLVQSDKNITVTASSIDNSGSYAADSNGTATKGIISGADANLTASNGAINNSSGAIVADNLSIAAFGTFTNTAGLSQSSGTTTINANSVNNDNTYVTDNNGYLTKGIISGGDITANIGAGGFSNSNGAIVGGNKVTVATTGNFTNSGLINAANALKITAANINNSNSYLLTNGSLRKGLISQSTIDLSATGGDIVNTDGAISSAGNLTLTATGQLLNNSLVQSGGNITANTASVDNSGSYAVDGSGNLTKGMLATGDIAITSGTINNTSGAIAGNNITATSAGAFTNTSGLVQGAGNTTINAASIDNTSTEVVNSSGTITKGILTGGILTLISTLAGIDNTNGALSSGGNTVINSAGLFSNHSLVQSGGNLNITAAGIDNSGSYAVTNGTLTGGLIASGTITLNAGTYDIINENGAISAGKTFSLSAGNIDNNNGYISANGVTGTSLVISANDVNNQSGSILSKSNLTVSGASGDNTNGGVISAKNALNITIANGGELDNTGGDIYSMSGTITGQNINNNGGRIQAANKVTITQTGGVFDNTHGTVLAFANGSTVVINAAQNILNQGGNIISIQNTDLNLGSAYTITGTLTTGGHVDITATSITNNGVVNAGDYINLVTTSGDITNNSGGQLISGTQITLNSNGSINNYGTISGPVITLTANGGLYNYGGQITSAGLLNATIGGQLYNTGRITAEGAANISAASVYNASAQIASNDVLTITTSGDISNNGGGLLYATNDLNLHANTINNTSAYIFSLSGNVTLDRSAGTRNSSITNTSGQIESLSGDVNIYTNSLTNNRTSYQYVYAPARDSHGNFIYDTVNFNQADLYTFDTDGVNYEKRRWYYNIKGTNGAQAQILSGRDINLNAASTYNNGSQIAANRNIAITGGSVTNQAYLLQSWEIAEGNYWHGCTGCWYNSIDNPGSLNGEDPNYVPTTAIVASSITAGNNLSGSVSNLSNATSGNGSASLISQSANLSTSSLPGSAQVVAVNNNQLGQNQANAGAGTNGGSNIQAQGGISAGVQQNGVTINGAPVLSAQGGIVQGNGGTAGQQSGVIAVSATTGVLSAAQTQSGTSATITSASSPSALAVSLINLPTGNNSLFKTNTAPGSNYLIETNVAFIDQSKFLGSDYFLTRIGYVPPASQKLLGDAFYVTTLVRQQIFEKTAQRYIEHGISTDLGQMQALMDNAVTEKSALNLSVGIELSATQIASLSSDIIWLVDQVINGQHALVPVVYLAQATLDGLSGNPANISAGNDLAIAASDSIENSGAITAGHNLSLTAGNNITNIGGLIKAGNNVTLVSTNGDIINQAAVHSVGQGTSSIHEYIAAQGNITAGGNASLNAANNITNTASNITSTGNTSLTAGNDITIETAALRNRSVSNGYRYSRVDDTTTNTASNITSSGTFTANAGNDIAISGSKVSAAGNTNLNAGGDVTIAAVQDTATHSVQTSKKGSFGSSSTYSKSTFDLNNKSATVASTGGDVNINAGNNVADLASIVTSAGNTNINAGNQVTIASLSDDHEVHESVTKKSGLLAKVMTGGLAMDWLGLSKKDTNSSKDTIQTTVISSNTTAGGNLSSSSGGDTNIVASKLSAGGNVNITAGGSATIASSSNTDYSETKDSSKSLMWQDQQGSGHANSTIVNTEITSGGSTNISAAKGVTADFKNLTGDVQKDIATLAQQPGMAYLATIQNNPNAKFNQVNDAAKSWDYHTQGLTQEGAAIIAIAVTIATAGAGTGAVLASTTASAATGTTVAVTGAAAAASNAAFAALASQAAVSLANNKGDVGKTLKDLGTSDTVKNMAFAAITAGATEGAMNALNIAPAAGATATSSDALYTTQQGANASINGMTGTTASLSGAQQAEKVLIDAGVNSSAQTAIYGGNLGTNFTDSLKTAAIYQAGADAAGVVGNQYHKAELDAALNGTNVSLGEDALHLAGHALVGCATGAAASGNCGAGAIGASVGEGIAQYSGDLKTGQLAAVTAALITGQDAKGIKTANGEAVNAIENNTMLGLSGTVSVSVPGTPFTFSAGGGIIADDTGTITGFITRPATIEETSKAMGQTPMNSPVGNAPQPGLGAGGGGSLQAGIIYYPGPTTVDDYKDVFINTTVSAGDGLGVSYNKFYNPTYSPSDPRAFGTEVSAGFNAGASASVTPTYTAIPPDGSKYRVNIFQK